MAAAAPPQTPKKQKKPYPCITKPSIPIADPKKKKNIIQYDSPEDQERTTVFFKLQNIPLTNIEEFQHAIETWVRNQNALGNYAEICGPAEFAVFPLEKIRVKQTDAEKKEKKRIYNQIRNQKEEVKQKRREKMNTPEAQKKRELQSQDENFKRRKRETAQDLRRATKRVKLEHPELWKKIRAEVKAERSKGDGANSSMSIDDAPASSKEETTKVNQETAKRIVQRAGKSVSTKQWKAANEANDAMYSSETETSSTTEEE